MSKSQHAMICASVGFADAAVKSPSRRLRTVQSTLLAGVSVAALLLASGAQARSLGGKAPSGPSDAAIAAAKNAQAEAAKAGERALGALKRATQSIQAVQSSQKSVRDWARNQLKSGIPDGLALGGLQVAPGTHPDFAWIGSKDPTSTKVGDITQVTIEQTQQKSILSWETFNLSENTKLHYDQKGNRDWISLNRVLDPSAKPSRILGSITADGTVLVVNKNGIVFGAGSQINVGTLMATTLDVGPALMKNAENDWVPTTIGMRNQNFLSNGLLGLEADSYVGTGNEITATFSALGGSNDGAVVVEEGSKIAANPGGLILLTAPRVINAGYLTASQGQVILTAAETALTLTVSTGTGTDAVRVSIAGALDYAGGGDATRAWAASDANIRGFVPLPQGKRGRSDYFVWNQASGLIEAQQGNIYLRSPGDAGAGQRSDAGGGHTIGKGAAYNDGILSSTTSVARNGSIYIDGDDIRLGKNSLISILADMGDETIPQDAKSLAAFKSSAVRVGRGAGRIVMEESLILAPSADVQIGRPVSGELFGGPRAPQEIILKKGAEINVAGLLDVLVPISENQIVIDPAKKNELRDSPLYRSGLLNGAVIYLDPRKSGVRDDGVAWIGSPLIDAQAYYALVGVGADRLMTKGGTVRLGSSGAVIVREGATIDMSGGSVRYEGGMIRTTRLVDNLGNVVDISEADPNRTYVAIANGFTRASPRWGTSTTWANPFGREERYYVGEYGAGRDAGVLGVDGRLAYDGKLIAQTYASLKQILNGKAGTGSSGLYGDLRRVQGSDSEMPAGGALILSAPADIEVRGTVAVLDDSRSYGAWTGGTITNAGSESVYERPVQSGDPALPAERFDTVLLSDDLLSGSNLSQVTLSTAIDVRDEYNRPLGSTQGNVTIGGDADIRLNPGGVFSVEANRIQIDGNVTTPSGRISLKTSLGSMVRFMEGGLGDFDIVVNGNLDVAGRWVNDYAATGETMLGGAWLNGGTIEMEAASNILRLYDLPKQSSSDPTTIIVSSGEQTVLILRDRDTDEITEPAYPPNFWALTAAATSEDISGRVVISSEAGLNLSGGGRVGVDGKLDLSAKGGNLSLKSSTSYFGGNGFRVLTETSEGFTGSITINPERINARVSFDPASIKAHGFGGGGKFTLVTPELTIGDSPTNSSTHLPLDFFSKAGFGSYDITSNKTEIRPTAFASGFGGYDAYGAVQTITVGAGQTLSLVQSVLPNMPGRAQGDALRALASGGDVNTVVSASVPTDAYDQKAVSLRLGGMLELHVAEGGRVEGAAGSSLTVSGLLNEGNIRIAGGKIVQDSTSPFITTLNERGPGGNARDPLGFRDLSDVFTVNPDGTIDPDAISKFRDEYNNPITNAKLVGDNYAGWSPNSATARRLFKLGVLDQDQGILLTAGSVTDLSGAVILNPRAMGGGRFIRDGRVVGGGFLGTIATQQISGQYHSGGRFTAEAGALIDLSGASGTLDRVVQTGSNLLGTSSYGAVPVWSNGGTLLVSEGGIFSGATIRAHGGSAMAQGGTLDIADPIFAQHDPARPARNIVSNDMIQAAGFDTLIARGGITSAGDATIALDRAFFLMPKTWKYGSASVNGAQDILSPMISAGGALRIDAPYIALQSVADVVTPLRGGTVGDGSVTFSGDRIDVTGAVRFDYSVANATLDATGDIRFIGVDAMASNRHIGYAGTPPETPTLKGSIAVQGDMLLKAAQVYPTTGTSFEITSGATDGTIRFARSGTTPPPVPYSAGGNLLIQAANIVQGGVIRVPFGTLTLGSNSTIRSGSNSWDIDLVPATKSVILADGSITSVSAGGLSIPYGTTTDTLEWYFSPTSFSEINGPPAKVLSLSGGDITVARGATVDLTGGGDVYAYEFVPGTGGSRDVLNRFNTDEYSANSINGVGYQYPDGRQVYAIVPGLSDAAIAAHDPIYSANYGDLATPSGAGRRVWLAGGNGLKAGWYTLLPAQYAMLPGGMRVVEQTNVKHAIPGSSHKRPDGTLLVSGYYGDALSGAAESVSRQFSVMSQDVIRSYSNIALTSGNEFAYKQAASKGIVAPRTGLDAGRLVLNPLDNMRIDTVVASAAAKGGRGSQVDIAGSRIEIVSQAATPTAGVIRLDVGSLNNLNAESLLIGATRIDNSDGTTNLNVTANSIVVANDAANPLIAPEIVLAVDNIAFAADGSASPVGSSLVLNDGAMLVATGVLSDQRGGAYVIDGTVTSTTSSSGLVTYSKPANTAIGALFRVANGPQRVVSRVRTPAVPGGNPGTPTGPDAVLTVGNVNVSGGAIGLDTSHAVSISSAAKLAGRDIALGVTRLAFTSGAAASGAVIITPELQAILSQGDRLTLRSQTSIGFDDGSYSFKSVKLDTALIEALGGGSVNLLGSERIELGNSGVAGSAVGGSATFTVDAGEIIIGDGTIATAGFGNGVSLTARNGLFSSGKNGVLDVGAANLAIVAPYMGDRGAPGISTDAPTGMNFRTIGNVAITNAGTTMPDLARLPGIPGSSLSIDGNNVAIAGTHLRSTAGALTVKAQGAIALSGGAVLEAPGYEQTFGDAVDPLVKSAPGGTLTLAALGAGGIGLGDAQLSVGNGRGNAGKLKLSSQNGVIDWGTASLDGHGGAGGQGGMFAIDTAGAIDLVGLNTRVGADGFTGGFDVRTRTGNIVLGAGQTLVSGSINLTADGGSVIVGGTIDTSGINGGDITLYGANGVSLQSSALLDAHAKGYAANDTRRAKAGDVTLGTDFVPGSATAGNDGVVSGNSGLINVAAGARIDVSAKRPGDRLVRLMRNGVANYAYVEGDQGGTVTFRAPVVGNGSGADTVNVAVAAAQSVIGARAVDLVGFKRWDLEQVAESGLFKGVTYDAATGTVSLDVAEDLDTANANGGLTSVGGVNFLGDEDPGTIPHFVQNFDVSAAYANLGGLATQANFHARPGLDLAHTGKIALKSNWNLGAGRVNLVAAQASGHMRIVPELQVAGLDTSGYVVNVGSEAEIFENLTKFTYRTRGGDVRGEAPVLNLRAGGDLELDGSLTDGFFMFRDQSDRTYRSVYGTGLNNRWNEWVVTLNGGFAGGNGQTALIDWAAWNGAGTPNGYLGLSVATRSSTWLSLVGAAPSVPYTTAGNSPAAQGTYVADALGNVNGGGDAIGSAEVFPLLADGTAAASSSYGFVAGAANLAGGSAASLSADPARVAAASSASITFGPGTTYQVPSGNHYVGVKRDGLYIDSHESYNATGRPTANQGAQAWTAEYWLATMTDPRWYRGVSDTSVAVLNIGSNTTSNDDPNRALALSLFHAFAAENGLERNKTDEPHKGFRYSSLTADDSNTTFIAMTVKTFKAFVTGKLIPALTQVEANLKAAAAINPTRLPPNPVGSNRSAGPKTLVQTLVRTGTGSITLSAAGDLDLTGGGVQYLNGNTGAVAASGQQVGGVAVYTAGHRVAAFSKTLTDPVTGVAVALSTPAAKTSVFTLASDASYNFGIVNADPVALTGGGDVSVAAQGSVLSRRNEVVGLGYTNRTAEAEAPTQPWRIVDMNAQGQVDTLINPQRFKEGIGTLGGGDILITAGGDVSDLSTVAQTSLRSTTAQPQGGEVANLLLQWGGGSNVAIHAAGNLIANRIDVASGSLLAAAGGRIGEIPMPATSLDAPTNETRIRIDDATVDLMAGGDLTIAGIQQLDGFYSDASALNLLANGSVLVTNILQAAPGESGSASAGYRNFAIYPGTLTVASLTGDVDLLTTAMPIGATLENNDPSRAPANYNPRAPHSILMVPSSQGQLSLLAGGDIGPSKLAMLDMDPYFLPGLFTLGGDVAYGFNYFSPPPNLPYQWGSVGFPTVKSNSSDTLRRRQHASTPVHINNPQPVHVYAGRDIGNADIGVTLSVPKQARIQAGRDIVNMVFMGQNLAKDDLTRVVAGRDIAGTVSLARGNIYAPDPANPFQRWIFTPAQPTLRGNTFILGGPGDLMLEAGRNMGPFLNSADIHDPSVYNNPPLVRYAGGVVAVGNDWNPYLPQESANITVQFGVAKGADYNALRETYAKPGTEANTLGNYSTKLVAWMQQHAAETLSAEFGKTDVNAEQAYAAFLKLPELRQRGFLIDVVYFGELRAPSEPDGSSYLKYSRGYAAVNTLFPAARGYTANGLEGGAKSDDIVRTGDLDLRLAAIETMYGGNINILGPGGRVVAGSVVATAQQAARRNFAGSSLYGPRFDQFGYSVNGTAAIPAGYEGVITMRGGHINTFTDGDFILNQSRLFTIDEGDITMWSSNADLNAGQGAKTTANFPPVVVRIDENMVMSEDPSGSTTGAGIAAFPPKDKKKRLPIVSLLAPRGTVDAGDAGVRAAGDLNVAALMIANADNFKVGGAATGIPTIAAPNIGGLTEASNAAAAAADQIKPDQNNANEQPSVIIVEVLGFGGGEGGSSDEEDERRKSN